MGLDPAMRRTSRMVMFVSGMLVMNSSSWAPLASDSLARACCDRRICSIHAGVVRVIVDGRNLLPMLSTSPATLAGRAPLFASIERPYELAKSQFKTHAIFHDSFHHWRRWFRRQPSR